MVFKNVDHVKGLLTACQNIVKILGEEICILGRRVIFGRAYLIYRFLYCNLLLYSVKGVYFLLYYYISATIPIYLNCLFYEFLPFDNFIVPNWLACFYLSRKRYRTLFVMNECSAFYFCIQLCFGVF